MLSGSPNLGILSLRPLGEDYGGQDREYPLWLCICAFVHFTLHPQGWRLWGPTGLLAMHSLHGSHWVTGDDGSPVRRG